MDGGSNLEQVPFGSLLVKIRGIDVVVAVDASADDPNRWPKYIMLSFVQTFLISITVQRNLSSFNLPAYIISLIVVSPRVSPNSIICAKLYFHRGEPTTNILRMQSESNSSRISTGHLPTQFASSRWKSTLHQVGSSLGPCSTRTHGISLTARMTCNSPILHSSPKCLLTKPLRTPLGAFCPTPLLRIPTGESAYSVLRSIVHVSNSHRHPRVRTFVRSASLSIVMIRALRRVSRNFQAETTCF